MTPTTPEQEGGFYPRLNAAGIEEGRFDGMIVSVVGKQISNDGQVLVLEDGAGGQMKVTSPDTAQNTQYVEIVGACQEGSIQHFVTRQLGDEFDMDTYNQMINLQNGKYQELFYQPDFQK
ncbi:hypothetical protein TrRE_jg12382 [Triparma retinervis]|uniref:Replication factor A protein 3 n=1 Tax=Triparma retinervis TaxID=2557542 RepID=A0A9W7CJI2_9STRA|nr:hypothetical protein TrRE_jg12382 [Triparma retinervis]